MSAQTWSPGQPDYGQPDHGQPQFAGAASGGNDGGPKKGLFLGIGAIVVAAVVVLIMVVAGVFSGGSSTSPPTGAVQKLLDAGKTGDRSAAMSVLCQADLANGTADEISKTSSLTASTTSRASRRAERFVAESPIGRQDGWMTSSLSLGVDG